MKEFNALSDICYIIVHGGKSSHADEQRACALAYAFGADCDIFRRDPMPGELTDKAILVLDVGMRHEPELMNFDHHQRDKAKDEPKCAYALLAEYLDCATELAACFDWYEPGILMDVIGPFQTSKRYGVDWNTVGPMIATPEQSFFSRLWAADIKLRAEYSADLGGAIRNMLINWSHVGEYIHSIEISGVKVGDCRDLPDELRVLQDAYIRVHKPEMIIFNDDRGAGLGLYRVNDCPKLNFCPLSGRPDIVFATDFIAKTTSKEANLEELIAKALV